MIEQYDKAVLTEDVPDEDLQAGEACTIVEVFEDGYIGEFFYLDGRTKTVAPLRSDQVRPVREDDVARVRA